MNSHGWLLRWTHVGSKWYLLWWHLIGRSKYRRVHGHDWHKATGRYPWWEGK